MRTSNPALAEGSLDRAVVAPGPLDDDDHVFDAVPCHGRRGPLCMAASKPDWSCSTVVGSTRTRP